MRAEQTKQKTIDASVVRVPGRAPRWIVPTVKVSLVIADALAAAISFMLAFYTREHAAVFSGAGRLAWSESFAPYGALLVFVVGIRLLSFRYCNLYRVRGEFSFFDDGVRIFKATAIGSLLIVAAAFLYRGGFEFRAFSYARSVFVRDFLFVLIIVGALRFFMRAVQTFVRSRQINLIPTLVVGRGPEASLFIREMRERPSLGYRVIGVVDTKTVDGQLTYEDVPVIGTLESLPEVIRDSGANEVIIADADVNADTLFEVMIRCGRRRGVEFRIAPSLFNCLPRKTEIDQIGVLPMIRLFREPLSNVARILKRTFDFVVSALAVLVLLPLWLLIALLIKLDSKGPVFYTQERVGMDGRLFLLYKFRTMKAGSDSQLHREYQKAFIAGRAEANLGDDSKPTYKLLTDPRITRIGKFLRRTSLDEVPQLFNVLSGDMSVVGPRPPIPYEVEAYELWHRKRLDMKPGVTGLWQVSGRNRLPFEEMVRLDLFYIENWSLLLDLKIILRTGFVMLGREGH
ncbi:MAG TPA: sugar transferase [Pyrinomonadaceae bacterium]|jgi:exopolysaccharide biosynthesis polyprenyl glycosylphosphotransferase|nr:sugar transferase [Pyrinomonadaceae bacterium]